MPGLMTIGSSRRLELTDGEQVLFVESSSSPMLEAAGSRPASQLTKAKRRVMSVTSEAALTGSGGASSSGGTPPRNALKPCCQKWSGTSQNGFWVFSLSFFNGFIYFLVPVF